MKNANFPRKFLSRAGALMALALIIYAFPSGALSAAEPRKNVNFNHLKTGFPLTGAHSILPCETCHIQGTFKGTPKQCATCHTPGSRIQTSTVKPANHIPTTQPCEQCHSSTASWNVARFSHAGVIAHQCAQCHNNNIAKGKPANHPPTNQPCDVCHRSTTWMSVGFTHAGVIPGACASCHGSTASGKPSNHIPTTKSCDACHTTGGTFTTSRFTHSATQGILPGQCSTCHNGSYAQWNALGKTPNHPATTASCDSCHTGFQSFVMASSTFNHAGVIPGNCNSCHGTTASGKPGNHIPSNPANLSCDACHTTGGSFTTSRFTHSATQGVVAGQCSTCHNGSYAQWNALGKTPNHPATTASCDSCHTGFQTFVMASSTFNHAGVIPGACATCHGITASGKPGNHIPTALSCDACHTAGGTFTTSRFTHSGTQGVLPGQCNTCHNGSYAQWNALGKPANHIATTASCDSCHTGYITFAGAGFNHAGVVPGTCASCHGVTATGKPSGHMVTARSCDSCHRSTATGGFQLPVTYSHTSPYFTSHNAGVNANCIGCHKAKTETIAGVRAYEPPNCYACHAGNFKPGPHKKTTTPTTILYSAVELRNCAGSCHEYTDNTFTTIKKTRSGEHRATSGGF